MSDEKNTHKRKIMEIIAGTPPPAPHQIAVEALLQCVADLATLNTSHDETLEMAHYRVKLHRHLGVAVDQLTEEQTPKAVDYLLREHGKQTLKLARRLK